MAEAGGVWNYGIPNYYEKQARALRMRRSGCAFAYIAGKVGVSPPTVARWVARDEDARHRARGGAAE